MHMRKQIRGAVKTLLSGKTDCADRVSTGRALPVWEEEFPLLTVYTGRQDSDLAQEAPREFKHTTEVVVVVQSKGTGEAAVEDQLDDIAEQIEALFYQDETLGDLIADLQPGSADMEVQDEGKILYGTLVMVWRAEWYEYAPADSLYTDPVTGVTADKLSDWERGHAEFDLVPADGAPEIETDFDLEQAP